jgi:single-strand DNA-binding protein
MEVMKMSLNRVTIIGHLGQDPELQHLVNGQAAGRFSVATDEPYTDKDGKRQERTEWHQIVVFGKVAETCGKYLSKGRQIYVEGRLRTREYEAQNSGGKRQRTEIVASRVQFLGTPPTDAKGATAVEEPLLPADAEVPF